MNEIKTKSTELTNEQQRVLLEMRIHDDLNKTAEALIDIGRCLNKAKDAKLVPHGEWTQWVQTHAQMNPRGAQRVMRAAREIGEGSPLNRLEFSKITELLALPAAERETFAEEVGAESLSVRQLREAVKAKEEAEHRAQELEEDIKRQVADAARETRADAEEEIERIEEAAENRVRALEEEVERAKAQTGTAAKEKITALEAELQAAEEETARRAQAEADAKRELLTLRRQVARGEAEQGETGTLTPEDLGEAARAFMGRCAMLPHMRRQLAKSTPDVRAQYQEVVDMVAAWCEQASAAIRTIDVTEV